MKNVLILCFLLVTASLFVGCNSNSDSQNEPEQYEVYGQRGFNPTFYKQGEITQFAFSETQDTDVAADTIIKTIGSFNRPVYYEVYVQVDSVSGSTGGTILLQQNLNPASTTALWHTLSTVTVNGVQTTQKLTGNILGGDLRLFGTTANTTQVNTADARYIISEKPE